MRILQILLVTFFLASSQFTFDYTVCQSFMSMEESSSPEEAMDCHSAPRSEDCKKMCDAESNKNPVLISKVGIKPAAEIHKAAIVTPWHVPESHVLHHSAINSWTKPSNAPPQVEVYLLKASLLI
ncbi:MAG: hypothetical protein HY645_03725 [Acidobacteria bacterium]|nr:hypothetical protein [Acidobacteriota bacterium]